MVRDKFTPMDSEYSESDFFIDTVQLQVYLDNYYIQSEKTIEQRFRNIVETIYQNDNNHEYKEKLFKLLCEKKIALGGRILANIGVPSLKNVCPFNCYASQRNKKPVDSIECIFEDLKISAHILKTEGGIGFNFSHLRPKYTYIKGSGITTPGVVGFMELYNTSSTVITQGTDTSKIYQKNNGISKNKVRKGASISMLEIWHPDIIEYIEAKKIPNKLTKFNMSVAITNDFMECLKNKQDWNLIFPDIHFDKYDEEWNGDIKQWKQKGYPVIIYDTIPATKLWSIILENMYNRNEPGLYFIDNANNYNNLSYYQRITGTNPCGEISMMGDPGHVIINNKEYHHIGDICNLGSIVLCNFYDKNKGFLLEEFKEAIKILVRTLDNIIDIATYPLDEIKNAAILRRKLGCGIMGYASLLFMVGIRYGSDKANKFTEYIFQEYVNTAYQYSSKLSQEKGSFLLYNKDKILKSGYIYNSHNLSKETKQMIFKYGLRNSQILTIAPTGNTSMLYGNVSSGCEPCFGIQSIRWISITHVFKQTIDQLKYKTPDISIGEFYETEDFKMTFEGGEEVLLSKCGNYKIDKHRGLIKKVICTDYGYKWCKENLTKDEFEVYQNNNVFVISEELTAKEHMNPFIIMSKYVDNSISKTINLKEDFPFNKFNSLFIKLWEEGGRGITTYRKGTMTVVIESLKDVKSEFENIKDQQEKFFDIWKEHENNIVFKSVKLPGEYPMKGYDIRSEGKKWRFHVCFKDKDMTKPFAIFVQTNHIEPNVSTSNTLELLEELAISENIPVKWINDTKNKSKHQTNITKIARMIGLLLRHNVDISKIIKTLELVDNIFAGSFVFRLKKFLSRFVSELQNGKRCPLCNAPLTLKEGCEVCDNCSSYSKC